jgi:hypothetical protein
MTLWIVAGALIGLLNAAVRWWAVSHVGACAPERALLLAVGGMVVRLSLVASLLALAMSRGIVPGLLAFGGLWMARWATVLWINAHGIEALPILAVRRRPPLPGRDSATSHDVVNKRSRPEASE